MNLVAIPWFSFLIVPVVLLAVLACFVFPGIAVAFFSLSGVFLRPLWFLLTQLARLPGSYFHLAIDSLLSLLMIELILLLFVSRLR